MKNKNYNFLILIRYFSYVLIGLCSFFYGKSDYKEIYFFIAVFLIYMINSQFRIYYIKNEKYIVLSLILDFILASLMSAFIKNFSLICYFISILDAVVLLPGLYSYIMLGFYCIGTSFFTIKIPLQINIEYNIISVLFNIILIGTFGFIGANVSEEKRRKLEAQELYDKLRISEEKLEEAYEKLERYSETVEELSILRERNRISREIHDSVGHTLSAILIQLQALNYVVDKSNEQGIGMINEMTTFVKSGIENVRRTVRQLKPTDFDRYEGIFAIEEMITKYKKLTGAEIRLILSKEKRTLSSDESFISYRIVQEALNNAIRHGHASLIEVSIQFFNDKLYMRIKDNGIGTDNINKSFGITGMEERVKKLGGTLAVQSEKNKGFEVTVNIPKVSDEKNDMIRQ
ncbi:sensor histidine kinase [Clostridium hydrogenum]|uniref:sensor histidine kinase n=1 Tax=Clostridium hydrogenum TaxID=2855764 RepID=UPI001F1DC30B|nr:sensor histidine kinase [Clostridium hydrogenum]